MQTQTIQNFLFGCAIAKNIGKHTRQKCTQNRIAKAKSAFGWPRLCYEHFCMRLWNMVFFQHTLDKQFFFNENNLVWHFGYLGLT